LKKRTKKKSETARKRRSAPLWFAKNNQILKNNLSQTYKAASDAVLSGIKLFLGQIGTEKTHNFSSRKTKGKKWKIPVPICPKYS